MKYFIELDGDRVVQIHHTETVPENTNYTYVEIQKEDFPATWTPPYFGAYLAYKNGFVWKSELSEQQLNHYLEEDVKNKRNQLLQETDWTQLADIPITIKDKYKNYRQDLRDITDQVGYPKNVVWPQKPL